MSQRVVAAVWLVGVGVMVGVAIQRARDEHRAEVERLRRDLELLGERTGQAVTELHGRIDAEAWLAGVSAQPDAKA